MTRPGRRWRMANLLAIDPGTTESAFVVFDGAKPERCGKVANRELLESVRSDFRDCQQFAIEMIGHYGTGMAAGKEVFDTCVWIGRFIEAWERSSFNLPKSNLVLRPTVKAHICGSARAKDGNVRQAIIDRYGGKEAAIGRKAAPGPLYEVSGDVWQALALAIYFTDAGSEP